MMISMCLVSSTEDCWHRQQSIVYPLRIWDQADREGFSFILNHSLLVYTGKNAAGLQLSLCLERGWWDALAQLLQVCPMILYSVTFIGTLQLFEKFSKCLSAWWARVEALRASPARFLPLFLISVHMIYLIYKSLLSNQCFVPGCIPHPHLITCVLVDLWVSPSM